MVSSKDFAAHFSDITHQFAEDFTVLRDDREVKPSEWAETMQNALAATMHLHLRPFIPWKRDIIVWNDRSHNWEKRPVSNSKAVSERMIAMMRTVSKSLGLEVFGSKRTRKSSRPFQKFVKKLRQHQNKKHRSHDGIATETTGTNQEFVQSSVGESAGQTAGGTSSVASSANPKAPQHNEDEMSGSGREHLDFSEYWSDDQSERSQGFDPIHMLPKAFTQASTLASLGIPFTEQTHGFAIAGGLDKTQILNVFRMAQKLRDLEELRQITCECLLRTPASETEHNLPSSDVDSRSNFETTGQLDSYEIPGATVNTFDEDIMYETCQSMTRGIFRDKLKSWMAEPPLRASTRTEHLVELSSLDSEPWKPHSLLGWPNAYHIDVKTGEKTKMRPSNMDKFYLLLDGFWLITSTSNLMKHSGELLAAEEKLLGAVFTLVTAIHRSMGRSEELPHCALYNSILSSFARLFRIMNNLEMHALTIETVHEIGQSAASSTECSATLRHVVTALLLATKSLTELENQTEVLEVERLRRDTYIAKSSSTANDRMDYNNVRECRDKIYGARKEAQRQKRFRRGVRHLETLGWDGKAARTILMNECRHERVTHHADLASRMLETRFKTALTANPSKRIQWKAAASPTDLAALLLTQILERPVLNGRDALNMYMRYITDLVSIFSSKPSRLQTDIH